MIAEVYDFKGRPVEVKPNFTLFRFAPDVEHIAGTNWMEKRAGWSSSLLPNGDSIVFRENSVTISAGISNYRDQLGAIEAIQAGQAGELESVPGLGVSTYTVTADNKIMLPKRSPNLPHAPNVYNTFSGWMTAANIVGLGPECQDMRLATENVRFYDPHWQAVGELTEESGLVGPDVELSEHPSFISRGLKVSFNPGLSYVGRIKKDSAYVLQQMDKLEEDFAPGQGTEHDVVAVVDVGELEQLLRNQPELQREDPASFQPSNNTELIILDEMVGGFVTAYEALTGKPRPDDLIDHLASNGVEIAFRSTERGLEYSPL